MITTEANIDIVRRNGVLHQISVVLPIWVKEELDNILSVHIPLLGIKTVAADEDDVIVAAKEAITLFFINAEDFGQGLEAELGFAGWNLADEKKDFSSLNWSTHNEIFENVMHTGYAYSDILPMSA